ncbi:MAG: hypothetical protein ACNS62_03205 [Candidatus Cyclobacteriaceae bacterium M3_2C_046]
MKRDFTLKLYYEFLETALSADYYLTSFEDFITNGHEAEKIMILRHDVDKLPQNALATARIQAELGVKGSYYFRIVPASYKPHYIEKIRDLGHEIGYHYEDVALNQGNLQQAARHFELNLELFRKFYPVKTICMHGSPMSKWDNRMLWQQYDYKSYGVIAEPYFDVDFNQTFYITDTGRSWNNTKASIRDSIDSTFDYKFSSTHELIKALKNDHLPNRIMQNIHPQRWHDNWWGWGYELLSQTAKNQVKKVLKKIRK